MDPEWPTKVVIPPLEVKLKSGAYSYSATGLKKDGYCFDPNVDRCLPLLKPVLTKKGTVKVHQPRIQEQPLAYWKAQCAFRNLQQSGTMAALQQRLRKVGAVGMPVELVQTEKDLKEEFWLKNGEARAQIWDRAKTDEQKAEADSERFLREKLLSHRPNKKAKKSAANVVVLKFNVGWGLEDVALSLGLCHESVDAPLDADGNQPEVRRWVVIGCTQSAVNEEIQRVTREADRKWQAAQDAFLGRKRKLQETIVSKEKKKPTREELWDVTGSWTISCPYVESQWGRTLGRGPQCSLDIRFTSSNAWGIRQMWAKFDFLAITGVFRFESLSPKTSSSKSRSNIKCESKSTSSSLGNVEYGDNFNGEDDDEFNGRSPTRENFFLGINEMPSASCPEWDFRWRGEETGEGEIEDYSDRELCSITFGGVGGTKLIGWLISGLTGKIGFTGTKSGPSRGSCYDDSIEAEWSKRSERPYECESYGRWGGAL